MVLLLLKTRKPVGTKFKLYILPVWFNNEKSNLLLHWTRHPDSIYCCTFLFTHTNKGSDLSVVTVYIILPKECFFQSHNKRQWWVTSLLGSGLGHRGVVLILTTWLLNGLLSHSFPFPLRMTIDYVTASPPTTLSEHGGR